MNKSDKNKKTAWQQLIGIVFMVLTGAVCGLIMVRFLSGSDKEASLGILAYAEIFIGLYATLIFHTLVHEAGHLVFGLLTGYGFCSFRNILVHVGKGRREAEAQAAKPCRHGRTMPYVAARYQGWQNAVCTL